MAANLRHDDRGAQSRHHQLAVSGHHSAAGLRCRYVFQEVPRPFHFHALSGLGEGLLSQSGYHEVPLGKGVVDWKAIFAAEKTGGIKNYFVELEEDSALMEQSVYQELSRTSETGRVSQ